ncbi:hypothetical protein [Delftia sp. WSY_7]|uniref:hypothetical protein n=1 Tax=Delftia sp. WSY_7 TaxID=3367202 RepID=UPI00370AFD7A
MTITRAIALSAGLFIFSIGQAHAQAFCSNDGVGNSINDGKNHYVLLPSRTLEVPLPFDIESRAIGSVVGRVAFLPYIINKKYTGMKGGAMFCAKYQTSGWYGVGTFHQKHRAYESSIPGIGLRIDFRKMPIPTDPSNAIQSYFPIQELSDAPIYIYLVKIGPIKQAGPLKGVFLQYKVDDVVIAQYQFDREATAPTGPFCTASLSAENPATAAVAHSSGRPAAERRLPEMIAKAPSCLADELPGIKPVMGSSSVAQLSLNRH